MSIGLETVPGRKGATSARREALDPINLVSRVMKEFPRAGVDEVCRRVRVALDGPDAKYQDAFNDYCTRNHFNILYRDETGGVVRRSRPRTPPTAATGQQQDAKTADMVVERVATAIETFKMIVLMEMPTPFGKPLGDLTEAEGSQLTGWHASVFNGIGNHPLRDVKTEAELQAAWRASVR